MTTAINTEFIYEYIKKDFTVHTQHVCSPLFCSFIFQTNYIISGHSFLNLHVHLHLYILHSINYTSILQMPPKPHFSSIIMSSTNNLLSPNAIKNKNKTLPPLAIKILIKHQTATRCLLNYLITIGMDSNIINT